MKYFIWGLAALILFSVLTGYTGTAREYTKNFNKSPVKEVTKK